MAKNHNGTWVDGGGVRDLEDFGRVTPSCKLCECLRSKAEQVNQLAQDVLHLTALALYMHVEDRRLEVESIQDGTMRTGRQSGHQHGTSHAPRLD